MQIKDIGTLLTTLLISACSLSDPIEKRVSDVLVRACPTADPSDREARDRCMAALAASDELSIIQQDPFYWGAQAKDLSVARALDDGSVTDFNPFVWRKIYLSVFTFDGPGKVEEAGKYRVLRMPVHFRNNLSSGEYPYPFWHSPGKWQHYEQTPEVLFYFQNGMIVGALRSNQLDATRSHVERTFDGNWTWDNGEQPRVSLFTSLFSAENPHVPAVEATYREFAEGMRDQMCISCHAPNNTAMMKHLELLIYPNQSLTGRHDVVRMLKSNLMPPGVGIPDQAVRDEQIRRAEAFAKAGDDALAFEGESTP